MSFLFILFSGYLILCIFVYVAQEKLVYSPSTIVSQTPGGMGLVFEELYIDTSDGEKIHAWFIPSEEASRYVFFLHGNGGNIGNRLNTISILNELGYSTLIIDYRGYGNSSGQPSEQGTYKDALAAFNYLMTYRKLQPKDIVIYGRSLGGAVAVWLAAQVHPSGLIIESTFSRLVDMGKHRYPFLPVKILTRVHYDSLSQIKEVKCPIFSAHSLDDETIPYILGKSLAEAAPDLKRFVTLNGRHNEAFFDTGQSYYDELDGFIKDPKSF